MNQIRNLSAGLFITVLILGAAGCGGAEARKAAYLARAQALYEQGQYDKARLEAKNALQIAAGDAEAQFLLGMIEWKNQNWQAAFGSFSRVMELDPQHVGASVQLGKLYLLARQPNKALEMAALAQRLAPGEASGYALQGAALLRTGNQADAELAARRALEIDPGQVDAVSVLAVMDSRRDRQEPAIEVLRQGLLHHPQALSLRILLINTLTAAGQYAEAEQHLRELIGEYPDNIGLRRGLAGLYVEWGRPVDAERALQLAAETLPHQTALKLDLAEFVRDRGEIDKAESILRAYLAREPDNHELRAGLARFYDEIGKTANIERLWLDVVAHDRSSPNGLAALGSLAHIWIEAGQIERAEGVISEVLSSNPRDQRALLARARIALQGGQAERAIADFRTLIKDAPDEIDAWLLLARAHRLDGQTQLARDVLMRAASVHPGAAAIRVSLGQLLLEFGDYAGAQQHLGVAARMVSGDLGLWKAVAEVQRRQGDWDGLRATAAELLQQQPDSALGHLYQGVAYQARSAFTDAETSYVAALQRAPDNAEALAMLAGLQVATLSVDAAAVRVRQLIERYPGNGGAHLVLAELLNGRADAAGTVAQLHQAIGKSPDWPPPYQRLGNLYLSQGRIDDAIRVLDKGAASLPKDLTLALMLASAYERAKQPGNAIAAYESVLKDYPGNDIAANNLAVLLTAVAPTEASTTRALQLVRRFARSDNAVFLDTLGWVHYQRGDVDQAAVYLRQAVTKAPDMAEANYHMGMVYFAQRDHAAARRYLAQAIELSNDFPGVEHATSVLARLNAAPASDG